MEYSGLVKEKIKEANANIGDRIEIIKNSMRYSGMLMPRHSFSGRDIIVLKLDNGYNIGIRCTMKTEIKVLERKECKRNEEFKIIRDDVLPNVFIIYTGGTVACKVEYGMGAVKPATTVEDFLTSVPHIFKICNPYPYMMGSILSENIEPKNWSEIARIVAEKLNDGYNEVIVAHGTDTLAYTSAALSFMLRNLNAPVVLIGSQRSSDRPSTDAYLNILNAIHLSKTDLGEVVVSMHYNQSDEITAVHRGTRVRKMHTSRRDAFKSIDTKPIAIVKSSGEIKFISNYRKISTEKAEAYYKIDDKVSLIFFYPGISGEIVERLSDGMHGIVIAGTGLGHVSYDVIKSLRRLINDGIHVAMTSQCIYGKVDLKVYETGRELLKIGVIPCEDMLPETALVKLMWLLANYPNNVKEKMVENIVGEISYGRTYEDC